MRPALRLAVALGLFGAITAAHVAVDDPAAAIGVLYVVPIGLVAASYGLAAGLAAGALAMGLLAGAAGPQLSALGYATRTVAFLVLGAGVGLAEQRAARHARRAHHGEEQLALLVEGIQDLALVLLDPDGRIATWNRGAERLFGWSAADVLGRPSSMLYPPEDAERGRPAELLRRAAARGRAQDEGRRMRRDGRRFVAEVVIGALRDEDGTLRGYAKVVRDVTDRRDMEDALRRTTVELGERARELARSNADLERFASVASHDLSEPLQTIAGFAELLRRRQGDRLDASGREFVEQIVAGTRRLQDLVDGLLSYARVGRGQPEHAPVDTGALVDDVVAALRTRLAQSGGRVERGELPTVAGDEAALRQVFQNLVANALKFRGAEPPQVRVEAERDGSRWRFAVTDNGIGLAPEQRERVFEMFARAHGGAYAGTGMGLAIVARIVEHHGGRIWVEDAPGGGTTFFFTLPAAVEQAPRRAMEDARAASGS